MGLKSVQRAAGGFQTSQGVSPRAYMSSSSCFSLNVSMPTKKPSYLWVTSSLLRDEPLEGLLDELLARLMRLEDRRPEDEEAGVDPDVGPRDVLDVGDAPVGRRR